MKLAKTVLCAAGTKIEMLYGSPNCLGALCLPSDPMMGISVFQGVSVNSKVSFPFHSDVLKLMVYFPLIDLM